MIINLYNLFLTFRYIIYTLHSLMQSTDQRRVFKRPPSGVRKIVLSTNIAETSVTVDDIVFVIDGGKVKEVLVFFFSFQLT